MLRRFLLATLAALTLVAGLGIANATDAQARSTSSGTFKVRALIDNPKPHSSTMRIEVPRHMRGKVVNVWYSRSSNIAQGNRPCVPPRSPAIHVYDCIGTTDRLKRHTEGQFRVRLPYQRIANIDLPVDLGSTPNVHGSRLEHFVSIQGTRDKRWSVYDTLRVSSTISEDARFTRWSKSQAKWVWTQVKDLQP